MALTPDKARRMLDTAELLCPSTVVSVAVARMAREITAALGDSFPLLLCVMRFQLLRCLLLKCISLMFTHVKHFVIILTLLILQLVSSVVWVHMAIL